MGWLDEQARGPIYEVELCCPACGERWMVEGHTEYGHWWPEDDDDVRCPECGDEEGEP